MDGRILSHRRKNIPSKQSQPQPRLPSPDAPNVLPTHRPLAELLQLYVAAEKRVSGMTTARLILPAHFIACHRFSDVDEVG